MISRKMRDLLEQQIGIELGASQTYMGMAIYFGLQNLDKWAKIFFEQSTEERGHARRIIDFLVDVDEQFVLPQIAVGETKYQSAIDVVQTSLDNEKKVTENFRHMAEVSLAEKDYTSFQFLQWFIQEQVEEEDTMDRYLSVLKSEKDPFKAELIIDELKEE